MGFSRQEYWSELPFPSPQDLLNPGIETQSPALAGRFFTIVLMHKHLKILHTLIMYLKRIICFYQLTLLQALLCLFFNVIVDLE